MALLVLVFGPVLSFISRARCGCGGLGAPLVLSSQSAIASLFASSSDRAADLTGKDSASTTSGR